MSLTQRLEAWLNSNAWRFFRAVLSANRDYPYHDAYKIDDTVASGAYTVGQNQIDAHGSQRKLFVSKSTLIMSTEDTTVQFNDGNNVAVPIVAGVWYEFKSNIWQVFYITPGTGKYLYLYFEGVLPEEARSAE